MANLYHPPKFPLLVASNPEMRGFGSIADGTLVCTHLQAGSHPDASISRDMGSVAGIETAALGLLHGPRVGCRTAMEGGGVAISRALDAHRHAGDS